MQVLISQSAAQACLPVELLRNVDRPRGYPNGQVFECIKKGVAIIVEPLCESWMSEIEA